MKSQIRVHVTGFNLDQLLNKIHNKSITIHNIEKTMANTMFFDVKLSQYKHVKPLLSNYKYSIKYLGMTNLKTWLKANIAILLAVPFILIGMWVSTRFAWNIKIYGAEGELNSQIIEVLKTNNIGAGRLLPGNIDSIEQILLSELPNVAQVSCIKRGTTILINVSPKLVYAPEIYEPIRASLNGIITNFSLISGTMAVHVGDFVNEGDVLVYPYTLDKDGNQVNVKPIAEVKAKAYVVGSSKLNATTTELVRTGNQYTTSSITFLNKNLFSTKY